MLVEISSWSSFFLIFDWHFIIYTLILPISQVQAKWLKKSRIRSHIEYSVPTYSILALLLRFEIWLKVYIFLARFGVIYWRYLLHHPVYTDRRWHRFRRPNGSSRSSWAATWYRVHQETGRSPSDRRTVWTSGGLPRSRAILQGKRNDMYTCLQKKLSQLPSCMDEFW